MVTKRPFLHLAVFCIALLKEWSIKPWNNKKGQKVCCDVLKIISLLFRCNSNNLVLFCRGRSGCFWKSNYKSALLFAVVCMSYQMDPVNSFFNIFTKLTGSCKNVQQALLNKSQKVRLLMHCRKSSPSRIINEFNKNKYMFLKHVKNK